MKLFTSSAVYFAIVFGAGVMFGTFRVMGLVPTVGVRAAGNGQRFQVGHFIAGLAFVLFYCPFFAGLCERLRAAVLPERANG